MTKPELPFPTALLWLDLEMTGLDPTKDLILEVAAEITDFHFKTRANYEAMVKNPRDKVVKRMQLNNWWQYYPANRDAFINGATKGKELKTIEKELIAMISKHIGSEPVILAGNSIHNDRAFIKHWMPDFDLKLHYRMLDVSSWKVFMQGRFGEEFKKPEVHRAFEDIQGSIAELEHYLEYFNSK